MVHPPLRLLPVRAHDAEAGDIILCSSATSVPGGFSASDFDDILFEVTAVPSATTIEVTMGSNAGSSAGPSGTVTIDFYYVIGPLIQTYGYGWGTNTWSGQTLPLIQTTLDGALLE